MTLTPSNPCIPTMGVMVSHNSDPNYQPNPERSSQNASESRLSHLP